MLKKVITYTNPFTDQEMTEEHYFHLSKADLVAMQLEEHGHEYVKDGETLTGMRAKLQRMLDSEDGKAILSEMRDIIRRSYGKKDGDRFIKTPEIWAEFSSTEAFSQLLFDICTDSTAAADFVNGVIPKNMDQIAAEIAQRAEAASNGATALSETDPTGLTNPTTPRLLTRTEVTEMDSDELKSGLATGRYKLS